MVLGGDCEYGYCVCFIECSNYINGNCSKQLNDELFEYRREKVLKKYNLPYKKRKKISEHIGDK